MPNDKEIYRFRYLSLKANLEIAEKIHARQAEIDGNKAEIARLTGLFDTSSQERLRELTAGQASNEEQLKKLVLKKGSEFLPVDYLLDAGLGLKGTLYYAYTTTGKAASAEGSISPLGPIGLNFQAGLKLSAAKGKQRSVVILRGPSAIKSPHWEATVSHPIAVHSLVGNYYEFTAKLSAELSIGWEFSAGAGIKDDDKKKLVFYAEPESKSHTEAQKERRSGDDTPLQIEMVGAGLTAKAGFQASIEYSYERFYAEDRMPLFYTDAESREEKDSRLRTDLAMILQEGSTKTMLKAKACALMAKNKEMFKAANPLHWEAGAESLLAVFYLNSVAFIADSAWGKKFDGLASIVRTLSSETVLKALINRNPESPKKDDRVFAEADTIEDALRRYVPTDYEALKEEAVNFLNTAGIKVPPKDGLFRYSTGLVWLTLAEATENNRFDIYTNRHRKAEQLRRRLSPSVRLCGAKTHEDALALITEHTAQCPNHKNKVCCTGDLPKNATFNAIYEYFEARAEVRFLFCPDVWRTCSMYMDADGDTGEPVFLSITAHNGEGAAELFATAGIEAKALHVNGELSASASIGARCAGKIARTRFQTITTATPRVGGRAEILTTFDSRIVYIRAEAGPKVEVAALITDKILKKDLEDSKRGAGAKKAIEELQERFTYAHNQMQYQTAIAVWTKPSGAVPRKGTVTLLPGSGVSIGASFLLASLKQIYKPGVHATSLISDWAIGKQLSSLTHLADKEPAELKYLLHIAELLQLTKLEFGLGPTLVLVASFLDTAVVRGIFNENTDKLKDEGSLLLEATYRFNTTRSVDYEVYKDGLGRQMMTLNDVTMDGLREKEPKNRILESIRLRYRRKDHLRTNSDLFSLGFFAGGNGLEIKLEKIERAGQDVIVDLATVFFDWTAGVWQLRIPPSDPDAAIKAKQKWYEEAVPPAPLFCQ